MKYKATQKLIDAIAKGTFEVSHITSTEFISKHYECLIDINKDWTLRIFVDEDAIKNNPDYFLINV